MSRGSVGPGHVRDSTVSIPYGGEGTTQRKVPGRVSSEDNARVVFPVVLSDGDGRSHRGPSRNRSMDMPRGPLQGKAPSGTWK